MTTTVSDLDRVREQIDTIDNQLLSLIDQRLALAKSLRKYKPRERAAWAPDREHALLQRLLDHKSRTFPAETLVAMWSALITCSLMNQGPLVILSASAEMKALGEAAFPGAPYARLNKNTWQSQLVETPGAIGILPFPDSKNTWWTELTDVPPVLRVQTCLPKWPPEQLKAVCVSTGTARFRPQQTCWCIQDESESIKHEMRLIARAKGRILLESLHEERLPPDTTKSISVGNFFTALKGNKP